MDWFQIEKGIRQGSILSPCLLNFYAEYIMRNMAGWHHGLNGCEFEWTPGDGDGQGGLACCDSWRHKESDTTERLNWTELNSAYKLNKQGDNIQPWKIPFPILNQFLVPHLVLTVASWPVYRFLRRLARWSGIPISLRIFHSLLWWVSGNTNSEPSDLQQCT